jgi:predicted porin
MQVKRLAIALVAATPLFAAAQSNVQLYGIVDAAISSQDLGGPEGRQTVVNSGNQSSSRFGLRGSEDLGKGLKAIFNLESGFNVDTGASDASSSGLFQRRAVVGLEGDFGTVTIGREYSPIANVAAASDAFGQGFYGSNLSAFGAAFPNTTAAAAPAGSSNRLTRRLGNSINYKSAPFAGFKVLAAYAAGETTPTTTATPNTSLERGNLFGGGLEYTLGGLYLGAAYQQIKRVAADEDKETAVGGGYKFDQLGGFEIKANWMKAERPAVADYKQANIGGSIPFGAHRVYVNFQQQKQGNAEGKTWALAYTYSLSKRTNLYASYASLDNNGSSTFGIASSSVTLTPGTVNRDADVLALGLRHAF